MADVKLTVIVDKTQLTQLEKDIEKLNGTKISLGSSLDGAKQNAERLDDAIQDTTKSTQGLNETVKQTDTHVSSVVDRLKNSIAQKAVQALTSAFKDALTVIREVDKELATIQKVTDFDTTQMKKIADSAYEIASAYGVAAKSYLDSVGTFAKAGYKELAAELGELATKTQLVGDVNATIANQFLLSVDAAWQMHGSVSALTKVLDEANAVENNYATSIEKIAVGLPNVASVAAMANVSVEETIAALGTITAVTQQTGQKASTALRSLFLNIMADTNTAFETETGEFVKWTTDEVAVLRGLLEKYASDVVEASKATGELINPMEAIAALSKAFQEGALTASELESTLASIGGKLRTNQLVALVTNPQMYNDMLETMRNSAGSANKEITIMLDTWDAKANILKNTWAEFVSKTISADGVKKILDFLIKAFKYTGDLGTAIGVIVPMIVAINLSKIASGLQSVGEKLKNVFSAINSGIGPIQLLIFTASALIGGALMYVNKYEQGLVEISKTAQQASESEFAEYKNVLKLREEYEAAKIAYESGTGTKQAYITATEALATALGYEGEAASITAAEIDQLTEAERLEAIERAKSAVTGLQNELFNTSRNYQFWQALQKGGYKEATSPEEKTEAVVKALALLRTEQEELRKEMDASGETTAEQSKRYTQLQENISVLDDYLNRYESQVEIINNLTGESNSLLEDSEGAIEGNGKAARNAIDAYKGLANSVKDAQSALEAFDQEAKTELDDALQRYTNVYSSFLNDWENGLVGSNKVKAAERLFFTDDQLLEMRRAGIDAGEMLASDFYQSLFAGLDEDGKQVVDHGLSFVQALHDAFGGEIRTQSGELAAAIAETDDGIRIMVEDVDLLSQALGEQGFFVSPELIAANLQALGMYTSGLDETVEGLTNIATAFGAVDDGVISLSTLIENALKGGNTVQEVLELVDALIEAAAAGAIQLDIDTSDVDEATNQALSMIAELRSAEAATEEESPTVDAEANIEPAMTSLEQLDNYADYATRDRTMNITVTGDTDVLHNANGTTSSVGGLSIVNERGPELIAEGNLLRIAGGGQPALTYLEPGATVLTASETRRTLGGIDPSLFYGGVRAFAMGTNTMMADTGANGKYYTNTNANQKLIESFKKAAQQATAVKATAANNGGGGGGGGSNINLSKLGSGGVKKTGNTSSSGSSSGGSSSYSGGGGSSSASKSDATLDKLKEIVSLRKSELSLLQAKGATTKDQINKEREIQQALKNEINYLVSIGGNQEEINKLWTEWYKINDDIEKLISNMLDELSKAADREIDALEKARDKALEPLDAQLEAMQAERDAAADQLEYEEKLLAVEEARQALANAMSDERKVRYWNASTGQWEHTYDAKAVASAQQAYDDAVKALADYEEQMAYDAKVAEIEAQKKAIEDAYDDAVGGWEEVIDALKEPTNSMETVLKRISESSMPEMEDTINTLNTLLARFGYAIGGYGGAYLNEMMVPTDITSAMIAPVSGSISGSLSSVAYGSTPNGFAGTGSTSIGTQYNGGVYNIGGISLTEEQARSTTVYELAMLSRNLKAYNATC